MRSRRPGTLRHFPYSKEAAYCFALFLAFLASLGAIVSPAWSRSASSARASWENTTSVPGSNWIEFRMASDTFPVISTTINGRIVPAVVDTGADRTIIDLGVARKLGLTPRKLNMQVEAIGGKVDLYVADFRSFSIGALRKRRGQIYVLDMGQLRKYTDNAFGIMIGADLLADFAFQLDWDHSRLRFLPSGSKELEGARVPMSLPTEDGPLITDILIGGVSNKAIVDTGYDTITISDSLKQQYFANKKTTTIYGFGIGGASSTEYLLVDNIIVGTTFLDHVPATISSSTDPLKPPYQARIGLGLLQHFNFLMDPRAGSMIVVPRASPPPPVTISTSGIQGLYRAEGLVIFYVMRGSPAEQIGLKAGDRICAVDGARVDASWEDNANLRSWSIGAPGRVVNLRLCDGTTKQLTLAIFY
jgi:predicted aspartyl protease